MVDFREKVDKLSITEKWKIYCRYLRSHFSLKYSYQIIVYTKRDEEHYNKIPEKQRCRAAWKFDTFFETWKTDLTRSECLGFDEFCEGNEEMDNIYYWYIRM